MTNSPRSCMAVVGNGFTKDNELPLHVIKRSNLVSDLYKAKPEEDKPLLAVTGKWSFWNRNGTTPVTTEAEEMKKILIAKGIPPKSILVENQSEDTIGNALFLKNLLEPTGIKNITIFCADFHHLRVKYIFEQVFGEGFDLNFEATEGPYKEGELAKQIAIQADLLEEQKPFIEMLLADSDSLELLERDYQRQLEGQPNAAAEAALGRVEPHNQSELAGNSTRRK